MKRLLNVSWFDIKDSLWYRPAMMTVVALIMSFVTIELDNYLFGRQRIELPLVFQGGVEGARGVLGAIASTMITVATTAFSVTLVALQLGSSQFSPRIMRSFTGDAGNQMVLGIFMATFAFSLSVLRTIRSETEDADAFVPTISVTIAVLMAFAAIGSLIYFFHHATRTIQASVIINRTYNDSGNIIQRTLERQTADSRRVLQQPLNLPEKFDRLLVVKGEGAGYLRDPDVTGAIALASTNGLLIEFHHGIGEYLNPGMPVATIWRNREEAETDQDSLTSVADSVRGCFQYGIERTLEYDPFFGMQQLSDIAMLALSPGTNDPSTAHNVLDRIGTALIEFDQISGSQLACADDSNTIRVLVPIPTFEGYARLPFDQIRHYGAADPLIVSHILQILGQVANQVRDDNRGILHELANELLEGSDRSKWVDADVTRVLAAAAWTLDSLPNMRIARNAPGGEVHN